MTTKKTDQSSSTQVLSIRERDLDLVNAEIALKRAARKARENADKAGTSVVVLSDGEIREDYGDKYAIETTKNNRVRVAADKALI